MTLCPACGSAVEGRWRFCIRCGAPSTTFRSTTAQDDIPPVIRPSAVDGFDDDLAPDRERARVDLPRAIGIALAIAGVALVVFIAVALSGGL